MPMSSNEETVIIASLATRKEQRDLGSAIACFKRIALRPNTGAFTL